MFPISGLVIKCIDCNNSQAMANCIEEKKLLAEILGAFSKNLWVGIKRQEENKWLLKQD